MKKIIYSLLFCISLFATEQQTSSDSNNTVQAQSAVQKSPILRKTADFFTGILDDLREFAEINGMNQK